MIGTINIRFPYDGYVQIHGHIGYGVRPSERRKGYATLILRLALEYCKKIGLKDILLTCNKSNNVSEKTIINCSGEFESEIQLPDGEILKRYWININ